MFASIKQIFDPVNKDLRKKIYFTLFCLFVFKLGTAIVVPGVDANLNVGFLELLNIMGGGAMQNFSIFALGVMPYITAQIIMQLLQMDIVPYFSELAKQGQTGRNQLNKITRILGIAMAFIQGYMFSFAFIQDGSVTDYLSASLVMTAGTAFLLWIGDQITKKGLGNGISMIIMAGILASIPNMFGQAFDGLVNGSDQLAIGIISFAVFVIMYFVIAFAILYVQLAERRIPVQYAGKAVGSKVMRGQSTHIPLSIIGSAVIAIIFAMSVMMFPKTIAEFFPSHNWAIWITTSKYSIFNETTWMYPAVYALLTIFFTWFYTQITFKPDEMAENLHKSAGFVPGIRPGDATEKYFEKVLTKVSLVGGVFAALLAILPILISNSQLQGIQFGGTSLLIMVGVGLDFSRQLDSQLVMRHYQGFLK